MGVYRFNREDIEARSRRKRSRAPVYTWAALLLAFPFLQGSSCFSSAGLGAADRIGTSLDQINQTMADAIQSLNSQSSAWQTTLTDLEGKLAKDAKDLEKQIADDVNQIIDHVDTVAKDGAQFAQEGLNCEADIIANHIKISLENLLIGFLNKWSYKGVSNRPLVDYQPTVCTVNPAAIVVNSWAGVNGQLVMSGVDFNLLDTQKPLAYILSKSGPETVIPANYIARQTNYRIAINVASLIADGYMKPGALLLEVRWAGRTVNPNEVSIVAPQPPPPPAPITFLEVVDDSANQRFIDNYFGGPCTPGYHRVECRVTPVEGKGSCFMLSWTSTEATQCQCWVRILPEYDTMKCMITITQSQ